MLLSGAIASNSRRLDVKVGIFLILVGTALLLGEYVRAARDQD
jgi:hypothetical protein